MQSNLIFILENLCKAILKIKNMCKELEQACQIKENTSLLNKLSKIPELILKSIVTNQSLYL